MMDQIRFIRTWAQNPLRTGAVAPSGPVLAGRIASLLVPCSESRIVELGPGTGVVTAALLDRGFDGGQLNVIEYSPEFCQLLAQRYPGLTVLQGDAYDMRTTLAQPGGFLDHGRKEMQFLDGIVSGLPLLTQPDDRRQALLETAMDLLKPGAPLIQFSYSLEGPVKPYDPAISVTKSKWVWNNLPPARIWVYRKANAAV